MNWSRIIFVVGFLTPEDRPPRLRFGGPEIGSGGFEWSQFRDEIVKRRAGWLTVPDDIVSDVREIMVPLDVPYQEVTDWLDRNPDLWEPRRLCP